MFYVCNWDSEICTVIVLGTVAVFWAGGDERILAAEAAEEIMRGKGYPYNSVLCTGN